MTFIATGLRRTMTFPGWLGWLLLAAPRDGVDDLPLLDALAARATP